MIIIFLSTSHCLGARRGWWMKLKIASAGLGVVMGVLVFVIFTFIYGELSTLTIPAVQLMMIQSQVTSLLVFGLLCLLSSLLWSSINISSSLEEHSHQSTMLGGQAVCFRQPSSIISLIPYSWHWNKTLCHVER